MNAAVETSDSDSMTDDSIDNCDSNSDSNSNVDSDSNSDSNSNVDSDSNESDIEEMDHDECANNTTIDINQDLNEDSTLDNDLMFHKNVRKNLLYEGSYHTTDEAILLILKTYADNNLTKTALENILQNTYKLLPKPNNMPKTLYRLFEYVKSLSLKCELFRHYYCKKCLFYYGKTIDVVTNLQNCQACSSPLNHAIFLS